MHFHRTFFLRIWIAYLLSLVAVADQENGTLKPAFDEVTKIIQKGASGGDIGAVIDWADTKGLFMGFDRWVAYSEGSTDLSLAEKDVLFIVMARSCLFSPRGIELLLNEPNKRNKLLGGLRLGDVTFTSTRPPHSGKRYLAGGGRILALTLKRQNGPATPVLFVGVGKESYKIGEQVKLADIEYVNTDFSDYEIPKK